MILLCIICSGALVLFFKYFEIKGINNFQAIVVNYIVAAIIGLVFATINTPAGSVISTNWLWPAIITGAAFFIIFNAVAISVPLVGVSAISVAQKMSFIIPTLFSVFIWNENISLLGKIGIFIAIAAILLVTAKSKSDTKTSYLTWFLPLLVFVGSGLVDTLVKHTQKTHITPLNTHYYIATIYAMAALAGIIVWMYLMIRGHKVDKKAITAGVLLGMVNYASMFSFVKALSIQSMSTATIFTINNMGIILFNTIVAIIFFKEKLSTMQYLGIVLALAAIALFLG